MSNFKKYYFTFGHGQAYFGYYHVIEAEDEMSARELMVERFENKWSMMYESAEEAGVDEWNLKELK